MEASVAPKYSLDIPQEYSNSSYSVPSTIQVDGKDYTVTEISDDAFRFSEAWNIVLPETIRRIGNEAFSSSRNLNSIELKEGLKEIGCYAFLQCPIQTITIPSTVEKLGGPWPFSLEMYMLTDIYVSESSPYFTSIDGVLCNKEGDELISFPEGRTGEYTTPEGVCSIGNFAFYNSKLTSLTINEGVKAIGDSVLYFAKIDRINIASSVKTIGKTFITPTLLSSRDVFCYATEPPVCEENTWSHWNYDNKPMLTLYVPEGCKEAYQASVGWKDFDEIKEISNNPTGIQWQEGVSQQNNLDTLYDLSGRKIANDAPVSSTLSKGIYIRNGKKVILHSSGFR
jgi:hypothetical protein